MHDDEEATSVAQNAENDYDGIDNRLRLIDEHLCSSAKAIELADYDRRWIRGTLLDAVSTEIRELRASVQELSMLQRIASEPER